MQMCDFVSATEYYVWYRLTATACVIPLNSFIYRTHEKYIISSYIWIYIFSVCLSVLPFLLVKFLSVFFSGWLNKKTNKERVSIRPLSQFFYPLALIQFYIFSFSPSLSFYSLSLSSPFILPNQSVSTHSLSHFLSHSFGEWERT